MKLLCINGIPDRGLHTGQLYTELDRFDCGCGKKPFPLVSVLESQGRTKRSRCWRCHVTAPDVPNGWYDSRRFMPVEPDGEMKVLEMFTPTKIEELV